MKAAVFRAVGSRLEVIEVPAPLPGRGEALLRVGACGICGSDLHATRREGMLAPGAILGHEFAGTVIALGPDPIGDWAVGDRVHSLGTKSCGSCAQCVGGRSHLCATAAAIGSLGPNDVPGAYAEHVVVGTNDLVALPDSVPDDLGALLEPLCVGLVSVRLAQLAVGARVLVIGGGPVGQVIAMWCRFFGARRVGLSERSRGRLELASALGATDLFLEDGSSDLSKEYEARCGGAPDVVFEAVGLPGMLNLAVSLVRLQGTVIAAGVCMERDPFDHLGAYAKEVTIRVPSLYTMDDARLAVELLSAGRIDPSPMLTRHVSLDELPDAFEALRRPTDDCKVVVVP